MFWKRAGAFGILPFEAMEWRRAAALIFCETLDFA